MAISVGLGVMRYGTSAGPTCLGNFGFVRMASGPVGPLCSVGSADCGILR